MAAAWRENVASLIDSVKFGMDVHSKLENLRQLKDDLSEADAVSISEFLPLILDLHTDRFSPVRKLLAEIVGDIALKHTELLPEIVPILLTVLKDGTPAVARQAIMCGNDLFRCTMVKVAVQGLYSSKLDDALESSWVLVQKFKDEVFSVAFQGSGGVRLLALKFVEAIILLYTPDPNGSSEAPAQQSFEGKCLEFNISWVRGGHPVLSVGDLSTQASQSLALLLDQLRFPTVKSLSNSTIVVLINSLSGIARKRPAFYGRILPLLFSLDASSSAKKGAHVSGTHYALKNAFLSCLKCTHPGAVPWRDRLVGALREMEAGDLAEEALRVVCQINGNAEGKKDLSITEEEKPSIKTYDADAVGIATRKKRSGSQDSSNLNDDKEVSGKRVRPTPSGSEGSMQELNRDQDGISSSGTTTSRVDGDNGPVQQLVAMFGALVAQGEKAVGSLEILVSSISTDLLAEVVMSNMRHLPLNRPIAEGDKEPLLNMGTVVSDTQFKHLSSLLTDMFSLSSSYPLIDSRLAAQPSAHSEIGNTQVAEEHPEGTAAEGEMICASEKIGFEQALEPTGVAVSSSDDIPSLMETSCSDIPSGIVDVGNVESEIPGLDSAHHSDGLPEKVVIPTPASPIIEDASEEQLNSFCKSPLESVPSLSTEGFPSLSTDRSEEVSPSASVTDVNSINSSTATSVGLSPQIILPKLSAPLVKLTEEEKDSLQKSAFMRILEAYKNIAVAGGSSVRFSLLAYLGVQFPLELDPWKLLQKHIFSDYVNYEGHELTLRVLYRLYGEAEEEHDFFSSTAATSVYELFLLTVAETLRDSFPSSDKTLSRLLGEVPYLPKSVFKFLECLCSPGKSDKDEELLSGERVTQGLSIVWSLIYLRPPVREACLKIALQSAGHHLEEVRMKAIRLVANKLYPLSSIAQQIEEFAKEMLQSVTTLDPSEEEVDADGSSTQLQKDLKLEKPMDEHSSIMSLSKDKSSEANQSCTSQSVPSSSLSEAQRCMSLYFALCTKKHALFREIFVIYESTSKAVKQAVHLQIPILVRTMGSSSELLEIVSDPPTGSKNLLMQVLHTLTDGTIPSRDLVYTVKKLYDTKLKDVEILMPILSFLPKDEALLIFPHLVNLPPDKFQAALARALQGSSHSGPVLTPAEVLIAIHGIDPERDGIPLKKVTDACNACFEQRQIFTQQVLAKVLNQLVEQIPLPLLFMRTVLQAIGAYPALVDFVMEILSRLVSKQIWKYPKLWVGFLKCALLTKPQSFSVLLQLPPAQLESALNRTAALRAPLISHANQPNIRNSLPRSVLVVLGIASDSQNHSQTQTTPQAQTGETGNSDKEAVTENSRESSRAS